RAVTCIVNGESSPAILYMFGIIRSRPCEAVNVVESAPACNAPWTAPAAPPSDCISAISGMTPQRFVFPRLAHSSQTSAIGELGVIGKIAIASLRRNATEAAASLPSTVILLFIGVIRGLELTPACVGHERRDSTTCDTRTHAVGAAGENHRHLCAQDQPGAVGIRKKSQLLGENVSGFEIGSEQNVGISGNCRLDTFRLCRLLTDRIVEREWAIENSARDLAALGHLAECRGIERRRH